MDSSWILIPITFLAATLSGAVGMGGGTVLVVAMASLLPAPQVVPLHGVVQLFSNSSRGILLWRHVYWRLVAMYVPTQLIGVAIAIQFYRGESMPWFRPAIGGFVLASILWDRLKPKKLEVPQTVFAFAGLGGGLLTILVGVTGPYLSAFFQRRDLEKEQIVATKAMIQMVGHLAKIPAFLSVGFVYREHLSLIVPLLLVAIGGTWVGTRLLKNMRTKHFRLAFQIALGLLALRLLLKPLF